MSDDDAGDKQWTDDGRERFRLAGSSLDRDYSVYNQVVLAMNGEQMGSSSIVKSVATAAAAIEYATAQFDLTGLLPPLGLSGESVDDDDAADDDLEEPAERVSVLHRADYLL